MILVCQIFVLCLILTYLSLYCVLYQLNIVHYNQAKHVPPFLISLIKDLHTGTKSCIWVGRSCTASFPTSSEVWQGCVLAPAVFRLAIDWIMSICADKAGVSIGQSLFTDINYADDAVLFTEDDAQWMSILESFDTAANTVGLHTSMEITTLSQLPSINEAPISRKRHPLFGHVRCMDQAAPAHQTLDLSVMSRQGLGQFDTWRRQPGRPWKCWVEQVTTSTGLSPSDAWNVATDGQHGGCYDTSTVKNTVECINVLFDPAFAKLLWPVTTC